MADWTKEDLDTMRERFKDKTYFADIAKKLFCLTLPDGFWDDPPPNEDV